MCITCCQSIETRSEALQTLVGESFEAMKNHAGIANNLYEWSVRKMEEVLCTLNILSASAADPLLASLRSQDADDYFLHR
jgi:hypothetical protein